MGRLRYLAIAVASAAAFGCTRPNPDFCDETADCPDGLICDDGGEIGGRGNACVSLECTPGEVVACRDDTGGDDRALICDSTGAGVDDEPCAFGCLEDACLQCQAEVPVVCNSIGETGEVIECDSRGQIVARRECVLGCREDAPACVDIEPSNGLATDLDFIDSNPGAVVALVLRDGYRVRGESILDENGEAIEAVSSRSIRPSGGVPVVVYRVMSLTIEGEVIFEGDDAIAFVSDRDIAIDGTIRVRSGRISGSDSCTGAEGGEDNEDESGGGGGGFGTPGGDGGSITGVEPGGGAGVSHGTVELVPLEAGCDGGGRTNTGGRGGGATQLVSRTRIRLADGAAIDAGGAPGRVDITSIGEDAKAVGGGGSGGGVLLEAPSVELGAGAFVGANGGGGACELRIGNLVTPAEPGQLSDEPAAGAICSGSQVGSGGTGGVGQGASANGLPGESVSLSGEPDAGGGGGGGAGRIRVNTASGVLPAASQFSPDPSLGVLPTR